jgi:hypothetical protein
MSKGQEIAANIAVNIYEFGKTKIMRVIDVCIFLYMLFITIKAFEVSNEHIVLYYIASIISFFLIFINFSKIIDIIFRMKDNKA